MRGKRVNKITRTPGVFSGGLADGAPGRALAGPDSHFASADGGCGYTGGVWLTKMRIPGKLESMAFQIPKDGTFSAYAMFVDLNGFTVMVNRAREESGGGVGVAQYVRDVLVGAVQVIEANEGGVAGIIGDALLGVVPTGQHIFDIVIGIARDIDRTCEYISGHQAENSQAWTFAPGGPSIKICIEYGEIEVSEMTTTILGTQQLLIGQCINYASRLGKAGKGNRCLVGPIAAAMPDLKHYPLSGPFTIGRKESEGEYTFHRLDLSHIWRERDNIDAVGAETADAETFWG